MFSTQKLYIFYPHCLGTKTISKDVYDNFSNGYNFFRLKDIVERNILCKMVFKEIKSIQCDKIEDDNF